MWLFHFELIFRSPYLNRIDMNFVYINEDLILIKAKNVK